ncbi:Hypothetical protein (plasmid) [Pseudomonas putida]|nr:Hypothetical protein [Pseudomonas putida]
MVEGWGSGELREWPVDSSPKPGNETCMAAGYGRAPDAYTWSTELPRVVSFRVGAE